jgi:molecular chaperone GrpE
MMSEQDKTKNDDAESDMDQPESPDSENASEEIPAEAESKIEPDNEQSDKEPPDPDLEIAALKDKLLRTLAEGENLRRRSQREREDTAKYAITNFARDMLFVADNLQRALASLPETPTDAEDPNAAFTDGVKMTERELQSIFERHGIEKIEPKGQKFDHDRHEAMFELPTADAPAGTVVEVVEIGYMLKDRLLRAAKVAVAKALPEPDESERVDTKV